MGDLVWVRILSLNFLVIEVFFPDIQSDCIAGISLQNIFFSLEISLKDILF